MINLDSEHLLTFPEATRLLPHRPHISTLPRWRLRGIRGIKLECCLIGGRRYTSHEAVDRFSATVTAATAGERSRCRTPVRRERDIQRAERDLEIEPAVKQSRNRTI